MYKYIYIYICIMRPPALAPAARRASRSRRSAAAAGSTPGSTAPWVIYTVAFELIEMVLLMIKEIVLKR